jgi:4-hydroxybenzoate polyprenyltransferase
MPNLLQNLLGLIRFSHTIFALPFALGSSALAWHREGTIRVIDLLGILICMVLARSAAMAFNRLVDQQIDAKNPRTASRHLPAGLLSYSTVLLFTIGCSLGFVAATLIFWFRTPPNPWPLYLSIPVLLFILAYSLTKRFTSLAHFWLGISLSLTPIAAWIAIRGMVDMSAPLMLGSVVLFWVAGFDILYACQDAEFDRASKLHSIPARFGVRGALRIAAFCHLVMFGLLVLLYVWVPEFEWIFAVALIAVGILLMYEHSIVDPNDLSRVNQAFFQVNSIISMGLFGVILLEIWC